MYVIYIGICVVAFAYWAQVFLYKKFWDKGLTAEISFSRRAVFEGETVTLIEKITNNKRLPLPYIKLEYRISNALVFENSPYKGERRASLFIVPPKKTVLKRTVLFCSKRGYYGIAELRYSCHNLFYSRFYKKDEPCSVWLAVYPQGLEIASAENIFKHISGETLVNRFILPDPFVYKGIREYQPFDSFKQINFKAWAKSQTLMSNVYGHTTSQNVVLFLNTQHYSPYLRDDIHESAIKLAAFLAKKYVDAGISVELTASGLDIVTQKPCIAKGGSSFHSLQNMYEALARIDIHHAVPMLDLLKARRTDEDVLILISAYHDDGLVQFYQDSLNKGLAFFWIIPQSPADTSRLPQGQNILKWVVEPS